MAKRALILKGGTMQGAFIVGAMKTVDRMLGMDYFDAIFATFLFIIVYYGTFYVYHASVCL